LAQKNGIGFIIMWLLWINGEPLSRKAMPERQKVPKRVTHRGRGLTAATSQLGGPVRALGKFFWCQEGARRKRRIETMGFNWDGERSGGGALELSEYTTTGVGDDFAPEARFPVIVEWAA